MKADQLAARRAARLEDLEFMAETGETVPGAAARIRLHPHTLRDFLNRAGRRDLFARLLANHGDRGYAGPRGVIPTNTRRSAA